MQKKNGKKNVGHYLEQAADIGTSSNNLKSCEESEKRKISEDLLEKERKEKNFLILKLMRRNLAQ